MPPDGKEWARLANAQQCWVLWDQLQLRESIKELATAREKQLPEEGCLGGMRVWVFHLALPPLRGCQRRQAATWHLQPRCQPLLLVAVRMMQPQCTDQQPCSI